MAYKEKNYITLSQVALIIGRSSYTIKRWYEWYESERYEVPEGLKLPPYVYLKKQRTKYFNTDDIPQFYKFMRQIERGGEHYGCLTRYNIEKNGPARNYSLKKPRKRGEYSQAAQRNPEDVSYEIDKETDERWRQEQILEQRRRAELKRSYLNSVRSKQNGQS